MSMDDLGIYISEIGWEPDMKGERCHVTLPLIGGGELTRYMTVDEQCPFTGFIRVICEGKYRFFPPEDVFIYF